MIHCVEDLKKYSLIVLIYNTGSSGEFLGGALTSSISNFAKSNNSWIASNRRLFEDALGKTLNGGWINIDNSAVVSRFNQYLENSKYDTDSLHLALAHPDPASMKFIQQYLDHAPVIEITTTSVKSMQFRNMSRSKVSYQDFINGGDGCLRNITAQDYQAYLNDSRLKTSSLSYRANRHLCVEWEQIMLTHTQDSFDHICNFLPSNGDVELFKSQVKEYLERNQDILDKC
jgi:hypothetical protein